MYGRAPSRAPAGRPQRQGAGQRVFDRGPADGPQAVHERAWPGRGAPLSAATRLPNSGSASVENRMISKRSSAPRLARQNCSAFFACSSFAPAIEPDVSSTKQTSFGCTAALAERSRGTPGA